MDTITPPTVSQNSPPPGDAQVSQSDERPPARWLNLLFFAIAAAAMLFLLLWLLFPLAPAWLRDVLSVPRGTPDAVTALVPPPTFTCEKASPPTLPASLYFIAAGIVSFAFGGFLGRYRTISKTKLRRSGRLAFLSVMVIFFLLAAVALGYEAYGTWMTGLDPKSHYQPITTFVRCGTQRNPWWVAALSCSAAYLVGHWLIRRPQPATPGST